MNPEEFNEMQLFSDAAKGKRKVDTNGLVKDVHIMGFGGTNVKKGRKKPYKYSAKAFQDAVNKGLYENISLQIGHTDDEKDTISARNNDPTKKIGFTKNTRFKDGEGVIGDLQLNTEHPSFASHKWWIENGPEHIALSNEALCKYNDSTDQIDEIAKVLFIALVGEGNTTNGIFKDGAIGDSMEAEDASNKVYRIIEHFNRLSSRILYPLEKSFTSSEKALQLLPIAQDLVKTLKAFDTISKDSAKINEDPKKENDMDFDKLTLEDLKTKRKDLVEMIAKDALSQEDATNAKVEAALKEIPSDKRGKAFVALVRDSIRSGKDVTDLIAEHVALYKDSVEAAKIKVEKPISKKKSTEVVEEPSTEEVTKDSKIDDKDIVAAFKL
jgi:hypothetical protein